MIDIYPCGTKVTFHNYTGTIVQISITGKEVAYEISYFSEGRKEKAWFMECEFETTNIKQQIGFKK